MKNICLLLLLSVIYIIPASAQVSISKKTVLNKNSKTVMKTSAVTGKKRKKRTAKSVKGKTKTKMQNCNKQNTGKSNFVKKRSSSKVIQNQHKETANSQPEESKANSAGSFNGDLRQIPPSEPIRKERPERKPPKIIPREINVTPKVTNPDN